MPILSRGLLLVIEPVSVNKPAGKWIEYTTVKDALGFGNPFSPRKRVSCSKAPVA
jgi:hypothetical protein